MEMHLCIFNYAAAPNLCAAEEGVRGSFSLFLSLSLHVIQTFNKFTYKVLIAIRIEHSARIQFAVFIAHMNQMRTIIIIYIAKGMTSSNSRSVKTNGPAVNRT